MKLNNPQALVFVPDSSEEHIALKRTTDLCIAAHQDDIEIMAYGPIAECFDRSDKWFTGIVVTDGAGSPRSGIYKKYSDEDMKQIRAEEQKTAATIGKYSALLLLAYSSKKVKDVINRVLVKELADIIEKTSPEILYMKSKKRFEISESFFVLLKTKFIHTRKNQLTTSKQLLQFLLLFFR